MDAQEPCVCECVFERLSCLVGIKRLDRMSL